MWSNLGDDKACGARLSSAIGTFLRVSGCGCPPESWSCFATRDQDSLYVEQSCHLCQRNVSVLLEWLSSTPSSPEERS